MQPPGRTDPPKDNADHDTEAGDDVGQRADAEVGTSGGCSPSCTGREYDALCARP
jgi:hypothetical protein